jgi:peroxiredoxin
MIVRRRLLRDASGRAVCSVLLGVLLAAAAPPARAQEAFERLDLIRPPRPKPAADFTVPGLDGKTVRLQDFRSRVVLLNFWATWCPPCKEEMPSMERLYRRYKARGFVILGISIDADGAAAVAPFVKKLGLTFPIGLDPKMTVANRYGVRALPSTILVDRNQKTVAIAVGPRDWDGAPARAVMEVLLK